MRSRLKDIESFKGFARRFLFVGAGVYGVEPERRELSGFRRDERKRRRTYPVLCEIGV